MQWWFQSHPETLTIELKLLRKRKWLHSDWKFAFWFDAIYANLFFEVVNWLDRVSSFCFEARSCEGTNGRFVKPSSGSIANKWSSWTIRSLEKYVHNFHTTVIFFWDLPRVKVYHNNAWCVVHLLGERNSWSRLGRSHGASPFFGWDIPFVWLPPVEHCHLFA